MVQNNFDCDGDGVVDWDRQIVGNGFTYWEPCAVEITTENGGGNMSPFLLIGGLIVLWYLVMK